MAADNNVMHASLVLIGAIEGDNIEKAYSNFSKLYI